MGTKPWLAALLLALFPVGAGVHAQDGAALLEARCAECHAPANGGLSRIKDQRKTPEAWDMTLVRMLQLHGVDLSGEERRALVKHLADTQGLAPAETEGWRYILEREPAVIEDVPSDELGEMCARCHSYARVALQRRTEDEWRLLAHFHLGQFPTTEYQALARDRAWWEIASEQQPPELAELYPLESEAWAEWQASEAPDLAGTWRVVGHNPFRGPWHGTAELSGDGEDRYAVALEFHYADGTVRRGEAQGVLYTGYEWRSRSVWEDGEVSLEVFALAEDGQRIEGRAFLEEMDSLGARVTAVREDAPAEVLLVEPSHLRVGESAEIAIHGVGLEGEVELGEGVTVEEVLSQDAGTVVVRASAAADAEDGAREVRAGEAAGEGLFTVYRQIDFVTVEPGYNIARVGDGGGPLPKVPAQFEAVAWLAGPDGEPGTEDDVRIGRMAASWAVENFDESAELMNDVAFAGEMQPQGLFIPAEAGPNPERPFGTNNVGNLRVVATVEDGGQTLTGEGQLLVTVQRWNDPPIR
jgi:quinohemoprotein amine dehydrogenase